MIITIRCSSCTHAPRPCPRCHAALDHASRCLPTSIAPFAQRDGSTYGSTYVVPTPDGWPGVLLVETRDRWTGWVRW